MITKLIACLLLPLSWAAAGAELTPGSTPPGFTSRVEAERGVLTLEYKGQRVMRYVFAGDQFKPYVQELYTLRGDNVLLDAPPDHLHHHGLMYAVRVNGVNFWEERDQPGWERPVRLVGPTFDRSPEGWPRASFRQTLHWMSGENHAVRDTAAAALLVEERTLSLTVDESRQEVALSWNAKFTVGAATNRVRLSGATYHGLGLRLPPSFNVVAVHENSEQRVYATGGTGDVTPARWSSVAHKVGDREITLALFGRREESGAWPFFFTMVKPFTYLAVTQGLDQVPREYAAGESFGIEYLLVVYPDQRPRDFLEQRYGRWK